MVRPINGEKTMKYKDLEVLHFLIYAESSTNETIVHLETLFETGSLQSNENYENLHERLVIPGKMLNSLIRKVKQDHQT